MRTLPVFGLTLLGAGLICMAVTYYGNAHHLRIVFMMCVYFLCAAGTNVLVGYSGQKSLGQAGLFAVGAYTVALTTTVLGWNPWVCMLLATVMAGIFGVLLALPSLRVKGPYLAMVTLAFGIGIEKIVTEWSDVFGGAQGIYGVLPPTLMGQPLDDRQWIWLVVFLCVGVQGLARSLLSGRFGRAFKAVQLDEIAASASGVNVYLYKVLAFVIAAVTCGLAGALVAQQNQYINSDFVGFPLSIFILLVTLFGGAGMLYGPLFGAVVLVMADALLSQWPHLQHMVYGALLLFALYAMPKGLAGVLAGVWQRCMNRPERVAVVREQQTQDVAAAGGTVASPWVMPHATVGGAIPDARGKNEPVLLSLRRLNKSFGGVKPAQDIEFDVREGEIHALIGPNGAGKSTMINMISGVLRPDSGSIAFAGAAVTGLPAHELCRRGIARTFQNLRLFVEMSVLENVLLGHHSRMEKGFWSCLLGLPGARHDEASARADARMILDWLGLAAYASQPAGGLAYGLQRRVELARCLASKPRLLLLDEPAAGLNPQETAELGQVLMRIKQSGVTILMVEHHMDLVMSVSQQITVFDYGRKIASGSPSQIQRDPAVIAAYLGTTEDAGDMTLGVAHA